jgi:hypothetical protein
LSIKGGFRVALATRLGYDDVGDWVFNNAKKMLDTVKNEGDIDTRLVWRGSKSGRTHESFVVTYPRDIQTSGWNVLTNTLSRGESFELMTG